MSFYHSFHWKSRVGPRSNFSLAELLSMQIARQKAPLEPESKQRWVIAVFDRHDGLCNRMMNAVSCLAFAMLTGRRFWIDWKSLPVTKINEQEDMGVEAYDDLFISELSGPEPSYSLQRNAVHISKFPFFERSGFLRPMMFAHDLNAVFPYQVISIRRYDFWGALLLADYGQAIFGVMFRALFTLKGDEPPKEQCSWLLQRRTKWTRFAPPPVSQYVQCAQSHNSSDMDNIWLLTDAESDENIESGVKLVEPNILHVRGKGGDRISVESMYRMSECKNAVLTATSTFGACVAALAGTGSQYEIYEDGHCGALRFVDPVDRGTMPTETKEITMLLDEWAAYSLEKKYNVLSS